MYFVGIFKLFSCFLIRYIQTSQSITSLHKILLASQIINLSHSNIMENDSNSDTVESELILPLPAPSASSESETVRHITLGETLKLDELGPIIINTDGTTRRITNWIELKKEEQDNTWRVISARNKKRIIELKRQQEEADSEILPQKNQSNDLDSKSQEL